MDEEAPFFPFVDCKERLLPCLCGIHGKRQCCCPKRVKCEPGTCCRITDTRQTNRGGKQSQGQLKEESTRGIERSSSV
ncbi:uncharacterized protein LOC141881684 isoform X2 [Acropora palmata]|uniref:uncharacterized protein LOC141881684 isoform X2 n=1 Tax=Acropora palmata TaxID=6131 RepID=UPI003DA0667B